MSGKDEFRTLLNSNKLSINDLFSVLSVEIRDELAILHMKNIGKESSKELYEFVYPNKLSVNDLSVNDLFRVLSVETRDELAILHMKNIGKESTKELYEFVYPNKKKKNKTKKAKTR